MKLTISTTQLQSLFAKAVRGAGNNKLVPMTNLIAISLHEGKLTLMTTDIKNYLYLTADNIEGDEFYVAVSVEILTRLVSKMTSEKTTLEVTGNCLKVIGNGTYEIALEAPDGEPLVLPDPVKDFVKEEPIGTVSSTTILNILSSIKSALLTTADYPYYTCYYVENDVTATDTDSVGSYAKGFLNKPCLISSSTMDLVGVLSETITVYEKDGKMLFESGDGSVYATIPEGIEKYKIDDLRELVVQDFKYSCKLAQTPILNLLDRISLFVGDYENGKITLSFTQEGLNVTSKYAEELIEYAEPTANVGEFTCNVDIVALTTQIKAQLGSVITIQYGEDNAIKLIDGDVTSVVALLEELEG